MCSTECRIDTVLSNLLQCVFAFRCCVFLFYPLTRFYIYIQDMSFRTLALTRIPSGGKRGKTRYVCQLCTRTLDDCLFADEVTKKITPFCKSCRNILQERNKVDLYAKENSVQVLSEGQGTSPTVSRQMQTSSSSTEFQVVNDAMLNDLI